MPTLNPGHLKEVIRIINDCPFFKHMSLEVTEIGVGYSVVAGEIRKNHMNPFGGLHGGVYASAIDTAAYWAAYCDLPEKDGLVSLDIKVDFIAPVIDGKILVKGKSIKAGKTIHLTEAGIFDANAKLLAHGTSKLLVTHNRQSINDAAQYMGSRKLPEKFIES
ncbi:MAG: PaaI family thioesterase [Spirochaetales bacterium]|jgi:uncharacterized protein (TIGR00369 family)|nr:PaaI family thioesterase [Spirochaetales bacterium]